MNNGVFWYKYRDDLYKKVTVFSANEGQCSRIVHKYKKMKENAESGAECNTKPEDIEMEDIATLHNKDSKEKYYNGRYAGNVRRACLSIEELALCNTWDFFVTLTLSPDLVRDRLDLDSWHKGLSQWLYDIARKKYNTRIYYILVPELHRNRKGWHMHGLFSGLPISALRLFKLEERLPDYIRRKLRCGGLVYDWPDYRIKYGFCDVEPIANQDACSRYVSKYIVKGSASTANDIPKGSHLYYCSRGLLRRVSLEGYTLSPPDGNFDDNSMILQYRFVDDVVKKSDGGPTLDLAAQFASIRISHDLLHSYQYDYGCVDWYKAITPAKSTI